MATKGNLLDTLKANVMATASDYQTAYNEREGKKVLKAKKSAMNEAIDRYNLQLSVEQYRAWADGGHPVEEAIRSLFVPGAIKVKAKSDENDFLTVTIIAKDDYKVSLPMMQTVLGKGIFAQHDWFNLADKACMLIANNINKDASGNELFTYDCEKASIDFAMPKGCDPLSDEGAIITLQTLVDKILVITDGKKSKKNVIQVTAKHWKNTRERMTRDGGVRTVEVCNTSKFINYVVEVMNGILTDGEFLVNACSSDLHELFKEDNE